MSDGKDTVRLEDTDVVADDGTVDMASLSKSGIDDVELATNTLEIDADAIDAEELFDAFMAGFMASGEGHNGELYAGRGEQAREDKRETFAEWLEDYAPGVWL